MMNKRLLVTLCLSLVLCGQQVQAASYYAKKAVSSVIALGYWGYLYSPQLLDHKQFYDDVRNGEQEIKQNMERYQVTDPQILALIQDQAKKRGFDPAKITVVKNVAPGVGVRITTENLTSLGTKNSFFMRIGDESKNEEISNSDRTDFLPYFKEQWKVPVLQHELGHATHHHTLKKLGYELCIPIAAHLIGSRLLAIPYQLVGIARIMRSSTWWPSMQKICLLPTTLITTENLDSLWFSRFKPLISRQNEKQADLSMDDDPEIIKGMIDHLQFDYDTLVAKHGKEAVDRHFNQKGRTHPHPLERIAYLTEKLNKASEKQKQENK